MSSGVVEVPLSSVTERAAVNPALDVTDMDQQFTASAHTRQALDDFPEGGYGWVVVLACSAIRYAACESLRFTPSAGVHRNDDPIYIFSSFFFGGLAYSWGMVQARLTQAKLASDAQLSFIGSTAIAFISVAALINVRLIRWLGTRKACVLGCFFLGLGPLLNGFATRSYGGLFVTNGLVLGFGTSLTFMVSISFSHGILHRLSHDHLTGQCLSHTGLRLSSCSIFQA